MKKIGLLGGTFDPPHLGHLLIAEEVYATLGLDEIWFIPSYEPPHKQKSGTRAEHRVEMVEAAIKDNPNFSINTVEIERRGKSYTIDTVKTLKTRYPAYSFYFIIGGDMVEYLPKWHRIEELADLVQFVGVKREDYQFQTQFPVLEVSIPRVDVSSTMIRERIAGGRSVRYLIPDEVFYVIKEYHLYETE
ncbi:nicotinate-nucleotide adenylyltransferase [Sediminibacillus massiliensis]|uniref:nicotinate-nucleotide adenylyltransferase n=1 Tax=Sediminibacillus massiliensis TaxID=1926277 RepID=UPI00098830C1|nr:nicotinate-nucleotide adenylyltransferase [Sediminibacillus massiliensis]